MRKMQLSAKFVLVLTVAITSIGFMAQGTCNADARAHLEGAKSLEAVMQAAETAYQSFATRSQVNAIENEHDRLYVQSVLDRLDRARRADELTQIELNDLITETMTSAAATQVGVSAACAIAQPFDRSAATSAAAAGEDCSCVQNCWNEYKKNIQGDCDFICRFGYALLLELCIADCLVPG